MAATKKGLGKGLEALFGEETATKAQGKYTSGPERKALANGEVKIKITSIVPNKDQPRKNFNREKLDELAASIKEQGVLTPLIVRKVGENYEIIAGERRWRASQAAGLKEVPVIVRDYDDRQTAEIALIENIQREDLNAIEEARAYAMLMEDYSLTQDEVGRRVSKNRSTITNALRLLKLVPEVQQMVVDGVISGGHARSILALEDEAGQKALADEIVQSGLSVREVEKRVKAINKKRNAPGKKETKTGETKDLSIFYREYEEKMQDLLGTRVHINKKDDTKGKIEIDYYSQAELERIMDLFKTIKE